MTKVYLLIQSNQKRNPLMIDLFFWIKTMTHFSVSNGRHRVVKPHRPPVSPVTRWTGCRVSPRPEHLSRIAGSLSFWMFSYAVTAQYTLLTLPPLHQPESSFHLKRKRILTVSWQDAMETTGWVIDSPGVGWNEGRFLDLITIIIFCFLLFWVFENQPTPAPTQ